MGIVFGTVRWQGAQTVANFGFVGAFAGMFVGLVASIRWPWFVQGPVAGILTGAIVGLWSCWLQISSQTELETVVASVVGCTIGLTVFRFLGRNKRTFYFRPYKK